MGIEEVDLNIIGKTLCHRQSRTAALESLNRVLLVELNTGRDFQRCQTRLSEGFAQKEESTTLACYAICLIVSGLWELDQFDLDRREDVKPFQQFAQSFNNELFKETGQCIRSLIADAVCHPDISVFPTGLYLLCGALCAGLKMDSGIIGEYEERLMFLQEMVPQKAGKAILETRAFFQDILAKPRLSLLDEHLPVDIYDFFKLNNLFENSEDIRKFDKRIDWGFGP